MQLPHHTSLHNFYQDRPPAAVPQNYQQHCLGGIMVYEL
uniref:Uncharacterized protein n=1 Tax=Rhizophora mucronata TaxID=61149 RepID=A0A2P2IIJ2_RHIMU